MKRLLAPVVTMLATLASLESLSNASDDLTSIFDIPPRSPESLYQDHDDTSNLRSSQRVDGKSVKSGKRRRAPSTRAEIAQMKLERSERIAERRRKAREKIAELQPDPGQLHQMSQDELRSAKGKAMKKDPNLDKEENKWMRGLWGFSGSSSSGSQTYEEGEFADPGESYDYWQQGYRMLGAFIDCDAVGGGDGSGDNKDDDENECSRWMMWAAYINPNYQGGGRDEYFSYETYYDEYGEATGTAENPISQLDCHAPDTNWELLGVYRQEFYQFLEQISKHLWAIDDYEYVVALAGLAYMTDANCMQIGYDNYNNKIYAGVQPLYGGQFEMALYTDEMCLTVNTDSGLTFDDFGLTSDMYLGSEDDGSMTDDALTTLYGYWTSAQEYTLALVNEIYDEYKYCTLCMDYPTYQDGYFIGDSGTDEDDMINQCWKFHSHDSYACTAECVALGDAQGTIVEVAYGNTKYGEAWDGSYGAGTSKTFDHVNKGYASGGGGNVEKFKANMWVTFNGILFVATFLAFSVARGARADSRASEKKKSLLSRDERLRSDRSKASRKSRKSRKSKPDDRTARSRESRRSKSNPKAREGARKSTSRGKTPTSEKKGNKLNTRNR